MHKIETILSLSGVKEYADTLLHDFSELCNNRKPSSEEGMASIFEELNRKAKIVANRHNDKQKRIGGREVSPDFFLNLIGTSHPEAISHFILVKKNVSANKKLLSQYPTICVKAEGFKNLKAVLAIPGYHKRERALKKLLEGNKREKKRSKVETTDKSYTKDNTLLVYSTTGDPLPEKKKSRSGNRNRKGGFNERKGGN